MAYQQRACYMLCHLGFCALPLFPVFEMRCESAAKVVVVDDSDSDAGAVADSDIPEAPLFTALLI